MELAKEKLSRQQAKASKLYNLSYTGQKNVP